MTACKFSAFVIILFASLQPGQAAAADYMSFSFQREDFRKYGLGLYQIIHAEGPVNEGAAGSLELFVREHGIAPGGSVYLESDGGSLEAAVKLGRAIRELGLNTYIGGIDPALPGHCASACTIAYLGGVWRFMNDGSSFSVQRFYRREGTKQEFDLQSSQLLANEITGYMREMGTDPALFKYMLLPGTAPLVPVDKKILMTMGAVNDGVLSTVWEIASDGPAPYVRGTVVDDHGTHTLSLLCNRQNHSLSGTASVESSNPELLRISAASKGLFVDKDRVAVNADVQMNGGHVDLPFTVSPSLAQRMASAGQLGVFLQPSGIPFYAGFTIRQSGDSQALMQHYIKDCLASSAL